MMKMLLKWQIAYRNGWITAEQVKEEAVCLGKTSYGQYLAKLVNH